MVRRVWFEVGRAAVGWAVAVGCLGFACRPEAVPAGSHPGAPPSRSLSGPAPSVGAPRAPSPSQGAAGEEPTSGRAAAARTAPPLASPPPAAAGAGGSGVARSPEQERAAAESQLHHLSLTTAGASSEQRLPCVVALHGLGDSPQGLAGLFARVSTPLHVYLPRAPRRRGPGYDWFGVRARSGPPDLLAARVAKAAKRVAEWMDGVLGSAPCTGKPLATGFSQGGMLSFALAALYPDRLSASLPISGLLPREISPAHAEGKLPPLIAFHGRADRVVPYAQAAASVKRLEAAGYPVRFHEYQDLGHRVSAQLRQDWARTLAEQSRP